MSQTLNSSRDAQTEELVSTREQLFQMIEEGRSFSGRERNCCFLNTGHGQFASIAAVAGLDFPDDGRAVAWVDWDQDGDLDLWMSNRNSPRLRFLKNEFPRTNHFLALRLRGNGRTTNRDAIGARVELIAKEFDGKRLVKTLRAGQGFISQSSKVVLFGLGSIDRIEKVIVDWPGGTRQEYERPQVDRHYLATQGTEQLRPVDVPARSLKLIASQPTAPATGDGIRVPLAIRLPMPRQSRVRALDGTTDQVMSFERGRPVFVNLWASSCVPCLAELRDLTNRSDEIRAAQIDVIALSVDDLLPQVEGTNARDVLAMIGFPFAAGRADPSFVASMQGYNNQLLALRKALPIPASFLVDPQGRLAVIYKGRVSIDQLLEDAGRFAAVDSEPLLLAACVPGRVIDHPLAEQIRRQSEIRSRFDLASRLQQAGRLQDAEAHYGELVEIAPKFTPAWRQLAAVYEGLRFPQRALHAYGTAIQLEPETAMLHYNRANLLKHMRRHEEAIASYRRALDLRPGFPDAHVNLGNVWLELGNHQQAEQEYRRAIALDPDHKIAQENLRRVQDFSRSRP